MTPERAVRVTYHGSRLMEPTSRLRVECGSDMIAVVGAQAIVVQVPLRR